MSRFSLRTRLIAVVVAVTIFALTAGGTATWLALRVVLTNRLDSQLSQQVDSTGSRVADDLTDDIGTVQIRMPPVAGPGPAGSEPNARFLLLTNDLTPITLQFTYGGLNVAAPDLKPSSADLTALLRSGDARSIRTTDGHDVRAQAFQLPGGEFLLIGVSRDELTDTLNNLFLLELAVGGVAVLVAVGLGTYGVRAGLSPLTRVTSTANEIAHNLHSRGSGLERRVPDADPATEVGRLTEALNTMLGAAQAAYAVRVENEERMRRFLADASHELRTPLTSLRGYAELERLRASAGADDPAATKDALRRIEGEGDRMARLVDDLLLLARADAAESDGDDSALALGPVPVDELLGEAVDRARAAHPGREFRLDADGAGLIVHADYETMLQVLGNLLRNAAIHTPGPRPIRIGARLDRGGDGRGVVMLIADEGPGMSPEQADHAFDRFWRADSGRTRATGGSGLGLPIVHALVEAQNGRVSLNSRPDTGTTVTVRLPLESASGTGQPADVLRSGQLRRV